MKTTMILAMDLDGVIGKGDGLPWKYRADMKWFREFTAGKALLMGRNTFKGIGVLPKRVNFVLQSSAYKEEEGIWTVRSLGEAQRLAAEMDIPELVVIGGKQVYESLLDDVDEIYVTRIDAHHKGDVKMGHVLFEKLRHFWLSDLNPAFSNIGTDRIFYTDEKKSVPEADIHVTAAWVVDVFDRQICDDVMLNFVKLTRCR